MLIKLIKKPTSTFVVENGKIYQEEYTTGYIIRDEENINIQNSGKEIVPIRSEGDKIAKNEQIYRYRVDNEDDINKQIEDIDVQIQKNLKNDNTDFSSDVKSINSQIETKLQEICENNNLKVIEQEKAEINSDLTQKIKIEAEKSQNENLKKLIAQRNELENQLSKSEYITSDKSGVISYRIDGYENAFKFGDYSYLNLDFFKKLNLQAGQIVGINKDKTNGKIVDNFKCDLACVLNSDEAKKAEVSKTIKIRLQNSDEVNAKIVYKNDENNQTILVFEIDNDISDLIKYRKISFDVIWWSDSGLKVPNDAIKYAGNLAYVIRNKAGYREKIYVKVLRGNDKYSIVENYSYSELKDAGANDSELANKKTISVYDQIEN